MFLSKGTSVAPAGISFTVSLASVNNLASFLTLKNFFNYLW